MLFERGLENELCKNSIFEMGLFEDGSLFEIEGCLGRAFLKGAWKPEN